MNPTDAALAAYAGRVEEIIERAGWMVQGVFPTRETPPEERQQFAYTVGVEDKGGPEFLIVGLPHDSMHGILNGVVQECLDVERWWAHGDVIRGQLTGGYEMRVVAVPERTMVEESWFAVAKARRRALGRATPLVGMQLVWPQVDGSFVADGLQPILGEVWW